MNDIDKMWANVSKGFSHMPPKAVGVLKTVFYMGVCEGARASNNMKLTVEGMMKVMEAGLEAKAAAKAGEVSHAE